MHKKSMYMSLAIIVTSGMVLGSANAIHADQNMHKPTIEKQEKKNVQEKPHPKFSWGTPGPTSPVLHPGSVRGAGMVEQPLTAIDNVMESMINNHVMPGAVTFVARRGHIVQHEAYGHSLLYEDDEGNEVDQPISMSKDTIFDLASISKIFTSTAAMKLYEQDLFELDDPVADYIPEFAENGKEDVTIRQLLTHTSGFTAWIPLYTIGDSREERLQHVFQYPLDNPPGTTYTYSDLNMITLGALIEKLSGKRLDEFVRDTITEPLKMKDTMYNPPEFLKHRIAATEYQPWTDRGLVWGEVHDESAWSLDGVAGHAGVFSTANDLGKLAHMFINDGRYGGKQILEKETVELLVENQIPEFPGNEHGLGWELSQGWYMGPLTEASSIGHTGYTGTSLVINQNNDTIAILLTNRVHPARDTVSTNPARREFARQVADAIPVSMPADNAWFSGYGDNLDRTLTSELDLDENAVLSFDTWHLIENGWDFGFVEVSSDGETWTSLLNPLTGSSDEWQAKTAEVAADAKYIRFRYQTDVATNNRGWYVANPELETASGDSINLDLSSEGWTERNY
ncbi:serine hydrolase [Virgibacillus indicus]|uniref:Serine hydrolase n=1 Tax=Virgibacillus indicus TaxID=2024554 RepID=A0A265NBK1_9BACI|nr:serine hydrolase domain-containing protein [Virgibacillus indicus]OZU88834.1 serine hydrolase [Virgibacillus indicus]